MNMINNIIYKIKDDLILPTEYISDINNMKKYSDGWNICDYIILHYTGSTTPQSAHNTYNKSDINVSWHLTIDRNGKLYQLLDFRKIAWHAGVSHWKKQNGEIISGMNRWSIGIELINAGPLTVKNNEYYTWFNRKISKEEIFIDKTGKPWHDYTQEQKETLHNIIPTIINKYNCVDILSHEDISPGRKQDTGPALLKTLNNLKKYCNK